MGGFRTTSSYGVWGSAVSSLIGVWGNLDDHVKVHFVFHKILLPLLLILKYMYRNFCLY